MLTTTSWKEEGRAEGRREEAAFLILRQLNKRFQNLDSEILERVRQLPLDQLESLAEALLDFSMSSDLDHWLNSQNE